LAVVLMPNQQATLNKAAGKLEKDTVGKPLMLSQDVAVRAFSFNNAPLSEIVDKLKSAYNVQIDYDHAKYAQATVTASLGKLPLDEKIQMICKAIDAECDFDNGLITIK
jgi:transmembrane sensor